MASSEEESNMSSSSMSEMTGLLPERRTRRRRAGDVLDLVWRRFALCAGAALVLDATRRVIVVEAPDQESTELVEDATPHYQRRSKRASPPHVLLVVVDDVGYNDVPWTSTDLAGAMPFTGALASQGVVLENYYTASSCTPARASMLTGQHPIQLGIKSSSATLTWKSDSGLTLEAPTLPQLLERVAPRQYYSAAVGKWDLGHSHEAYLPLQRGFSSYFGMLADMYYDYSRLISTVTDDAGPLYDLTEGNSPTCPLQGTYATDLWRDKALEAVDNTPDGKSLFLYLAFNAIHTQLSISDEMASGDAEYESLKGAVDAGEFTEARQTAAGALLSVDRAMSALFAKLDEKDFTKDTLLVFVSDNGALTGSGGSNYPLRGEKLQIWEGGNRVPAFLWAGANLASSLQMSSGTYKGLVHVADIAPTILGAVTQTAPSLSYGLDLHSSILSGGTVRRTEILYTIESTSAKDVTGAALPLAAVRDTRYKLVTSAPYCSVATVSEQVQCDCDSVRQTALFDLEEDPYETVDVSASHPDVVAKLTASLDFAFQELPPDSTNWSQDMVGTDQGAVNTATQTAIFASATSAGSSCGYMTIMILAPWLSSVPEALQVDFLGLESINDLSWLPTTDNATRSSLADVQFCDQGTPFGSKDYTGYEPT